MTTGIEHFGRELLELDERIGRLALACGVSLANMTEIVALIKGNFAVCRHSDNPKRQELRALLMMKYRSEQRCLAALGNEECLRLINEAEQYLQRRGFAVGVGSNSD